MNLIKKMMTMSAIAAVAGGMITATPAIAAESPRTTVKARVAALDDCRYQAVFEGPSFLFDYHAEATFRSFSSLPTPRKATTEYYKDFGYSWSYRQVLQFDICPVKWAGDYLNTIKIVGVSRFQPEEIVTSSELQPQDSSVVPTTPVLTKAQLNKDKTVDLEWSPSAVGKNKIDEYLLHEVTPTYSSEVGWFRSPYTTHLAPKNTKTVRPVIKVPEKETVDRTQVYWVHASANGFLNDLRDEKKLSVRPN